MASSIYSQKKNRQKIEYRSSAFFKVGDEFLIKDGQVVYYKLPDYAECNNKAVSLIEVSVKKRK